MATEVIRSPEAVVPSISTRFVSALAGGQLAGLVMAVVMMAVYGIVLRMNVLYPVQVIASILLGHRALEAQTPGVLATGLLFHQLGPSLIWSAGYFFCVAMLRYRIDLNRALMIGLLIGLASEIIDVYVVGPFLQGMTSGEDLWMQHVPRFWDWAAHAVYGLSLGLFYWLVRSAIEKRRGVERIHTPTTVTADRSGVHRNR